MAPEPDHKPVPGYVRRIEELTDEALAGNKDSRRTLARVIDRWLQVLQDIEARDR